LIDHRAGVLNHNLQRVISTLEWKQLIESSKAKIKSNLCAMQEKTINDLDVVLEKTRVSHRKLRKRVEKFESEMYDVKGYEPTLANISVLNTDNSLMRAPSASFINPKGRIVRTFKRKSLFKPASEVNLFKKSIARNSKPGKQVPGSQNSLNVVQALPSIQITAPEGISAIQTSSPPPQSHFNTPHYYSPSDFSNILFKTHLLKLLMKNFLQMKACPQM
jgi:hypothetical protein